MERVKVDTKDGRERGDAMVFYNKCPRENSEVTWTQWNDAKNDLICCDIEDESL